MVLKIFRNFFVFPENRKIYRINSETPNNSPKQVKKNMEKELKKQSQIQTERLVYFDLVQKNFGDKEKVVPKAEIKTRAWPVHEKTITEIKTSEVLNKEPEKKKLRRLFFGFSVVLGGFFIFFGAALAGFYLTPFLFEPVAFVYGDGNFTEGNGKFDSDGTSLSQESEFGKENLVENRDSKMSENPFEMSGEKRGSVDKETRQTAEKNNMPFGKSEEVGRKSTKNKAEISSNNSEVRENRRFSNDETNLSSAPETEISGQTKPPDYLLKNKTETFRPGIIKPEPPNGGSVSERQKNIVRKRPPTIVRNREVLAPGIKKQRNRKRPPRKRIKRRIRKPFPK